MPLIELTEPLGIRRAAHLLRRICFGGSIGEIEAFAQLTPAQALERLFIQDLPAPNYPIDPLTGSEWITTGIAESEGFELERYLLCWHLGQLLGHEIEAPVRLAYIFRERLVYFFHSHFTTQRSVVNNTRSLYYQLALFRQFAFDQSDRIILAPEPEEGEERDPDTVYQRNFKQLTKKICVDNAMLMFLDGRLNVKGSPNENFARELLELYTIGKGLEGFVPEPEFEGDYFVFTEQDVQEGAKVLSGFNIDQNFSNIDIETDLPRGRIRGGTIASSHDNSIKRFSQRLGNGIIAPDPALMIGQNPTEASVLDEISQLIDLIYDQPETPRAICRKLYRFFVYHQVDEQVQNGIIQELADLFVASDYKIQPVIEALLKSRFFYEGEAGVNDNIFGSLIKSPVDMVLGFMRNFEIEIPSFSQNLTAYYEFTGRLLNAIRSQGLDYYEPLDVAGYSGYHQFPGFNRNWITTNYLVNRYNYVNQTINNGMNMETGKIDIYRFVRENISDEIGRDAKQLIKTIASYFLPLADELTFEGGGNGELTVERLNYFLAAFLYSPQFDPDPEEAWTFRWTNRTDEETMANQLVNLINAMLQSPEYQLM